MASVRSLGLGLALLFSLVSLLLPHSLASPVLCEELPQDLCVFAVSTASKRCVLESVPPQRGGGTTEYYQCQTSGVVVEGMLNWIETDECVRACGMDRGVVGISSDSLLEPQVAAKLCSPACYLNCPNIVELYFNLAAGEGAYLPDLCALSRSNPHRSMVELMSSGAVVMEEIAPLSPVASPPASI